MKALKVWIVLACSAVGIALAGPARAQQDAEFQLSFCNMSAYSNVKIAVTRRQDAQRWLVEGWYPIPEDGCAVVGSFLRDTIFYYAFGQTNDGRIVTWSPPATDTTAVAQCVDFDKFFRAPSGGPSCASGQESVRFRPIKIAPNRPRLTWTLSGGR